jgi:hypothetical protein
MDITGAMQLSDYSSIYDYMAIVNSKDNLTILMEDVGSESIGIICSMLQNNNFKVDLDNSYDNSKCLIKAFKENSV